MEILEFDRITKDGYHRPLEVNPTITSIESEPLVLEGIAARNITERKQTKERLLKSENVYA